MAEYCRRDLSETGEGLERGRGGAMLAVNRSQLDKADVGGFIMRVWPSITLLISEDFPSYTP